MTKIINTTATTNTGDPIMDSAINMAQNGGYTYTMPVYSNSTTTGGNIWTTNGSPYNYTWNNTGNFSSVNIEESGDIKIGNRSLKNFMQAMEKRLYILEEPDPKKLEKFAALKEAYEYYKMMEKLIGE